MEEQKNKTTGKEIYYYSFVCIRTWPCLENGLEDLKLFLEKQLAFFFKSFKNARRYANSWTHDDMVGGTLCIEFEGDKSFAWFVDFPKSKIEITDDIPDLKSKLHLAHEEKNIEEVYFYPFSRNLENRSLEEEVEDLKNQIYSSDDPIKVYEDLSFLPDFMGDSDFIGDFFERNNFLGIEKIDGKYIGWLLSPSKYEFELPQEIIGKLSLANKQDDKKLILK